MLENPNTFFFISCMYYFSNINVLLKIDNSPKKTNCFGLFLQKFPIHRYEWLTCTFSWGPPSHTGMDRWLCAEREKHFGQINLVLYVQTKLNAARKRAKEEKKSKPLIRLLFSSFTICCSRLKVKSLFYVHFPLILCGMREKGLECVCVCMSPTSVSVFL